MNSFSQIGPANGISTYRMFLFTIVENLGLCVVLTDSLKVFLNALFWVQIALSSLGIAGSLLAVVACASRKVRSSCCVQLACLALYDVFFLIACLALAVLGLINIDSWSGPATKFFLTLRNLSLWGATYTTLDICAERCLSIASPFLAHRRLTVGLAMKRAAAILITGVCFTVPYVIDLVNGYSVGNECVEDRHLTTFGLVYTLYISLLLLYLLPFAAVIIFNIVFAVILCRLRRRAVRPKGDNTSAERRLSILVLGLSSWYSISMLAPSLLFLVRLTKIELFQPETDIRLAAAADTVVVLSSCSNFLFYFLLWSPFRRIVHGWLWKKLGRNLPSTSANTISGQHHTFRSTIHSQQQESSH